MSLGGLVEQLRDLRDIGFHDVLPVSAGPSVAGARSVWEIARAAGLTSPMWLKACGCCPAHQLRIYRVPPWLPGLMPRQWTAPVATCGAGRSPDKEAVAAGRSLVRPQPLLKRAC